MQLFCDDVFYVNNKDAWMRWMRFKSWISINGIYNSLILKTIYFNRLTEWFYQSKLFLFFYNKIKCWWLVLFSLIIVSLSISISMAISFGSHDLVHVAEFFFLFYSFRINFLVFRRDHFTIKKNNTCELIWLGFAWLILCI